LRRVLGRVLSVPRLNQLAALYREATGQVVVGSDLVRRLDADERPIQGQWAARRACTPPPTEPGDTYPVDPTIPSFCVAGRRASSRPSSNSPLLTCDNRIRCDKRGRTAQSENAPLIRLVLTSWVGDPQSRHELT